MDIGLEPDLIRLLAYGPIRSITVLLSFVMEIQVVLDPVPVVMILRVALASKELEAQPSLLAQNFLLALLPITTGPFVQEILFNMPH